MFALLTFLWCWVMSKRKSVAVGLKTIFFEIALSAIVFGILMEFVQRYFVPGRSFDIGDMIADAAGALAGYFYSRWKFIKK